MDLTDERRILFYRAKSIIDIQRFATYLFKVDFIHRPASETVSNRFEDVLEGGPSKRVVASVRRGRKEEWNVQRLLAALLASDFSGKQALRLNLIATNRKYRRAWRTITSGFEDFRYTSPRLVMRYSLALHPATFVKLGERSAFGGPVAAI